MVNSGYFFRTIVALISQKSLSYYKCMQVKCQSNCFITYFITSHSKAYCHFRHGKHLRDSAMLCTEKLFVAKEWEEFILKSNNNYKEL